MPARQARLVGMGTSRAAISEILLVVATLAIALWSALPASAVATPTLVVAPSTALHNDRVVKVIGSGFKPHDHVFLVECLASATGQSQCDINTATPATITAKGVLPRTKFTVVSGKVGTGHCGTALSNLKACVINAGNANGGDTASTPITFAPPKRAR